MGAAVLGCCALGPAAVLGSWIGADVGDGVQEAVTSSTASTTTDRPRRVADDLGKQRIAASFPGVDG